jgi:sugar lactone lactonase YvrE
MRIRRTLALTGCAAGLLAACTTVSAASEPADITIVGSRVFPESIASDAAGNIYVGSNGGTIYRALAGTTKAEPWIVPSEANGLRSLFGVFADDGHKVLWACSIPNLFAQPRETGTSVLKAFDLATGALKASYEFPADKPSACNDIAVARDGTVYASETLSGRIMALRPGAEALTLFAEGQDLVGIVGIAIAGDGAIYINNVRQNLFQRVNLNADGSYAGLTTLTLSDKLNGPDGLRAMGGNRFLQAEGPGGRVALIEVDGDSATVTPVKTGLESSPGVAQVGAIGYAIEGKSNYMFDPALRDKDPGPFVLRAFPLPQ